MRKSAFTEAEILGYDEFWITAKKMKAKGYALQDIVSLTGLSQEEIEAL